MKKSLYFLLFCAGLLCCLTNFANGQKQANNWYFGSYAGLNFSSGAPVPLTNGNLVTNEGCATISDGTTGNLLFYTDGVTVWNSQHGVMPNGTGLLGNSSTTQSAIAVPVPGSNTQYYIFTVDAQAGLEPPSTTGFGGFAYSILDMTLDGGLGDITSTKNVRLLTPTCEKLTAVRACNGLDIWVVVHQWNTNAFYAYLITPTGISAPVISNTGIVHQDVGSGVKHETTGYMKFSPDAKKLALVCYYDLNTMQFFDFDNNTGIISNPVTDNSFNTLLAEDIAAGNGLYGCAFSPDNSKLYVGWFGYGNYDYYLEGIYPSYLWQYNMQAGDSAAIVSSRTLIYSSAQFGYGAIQIGPDGKMYMSKTDRSNTTNGYSNYLDVINDPNALGTACNFVSGGLYLGGVSNQCIFGLPDIVESFLIPQYAASFTYNGCTGSTSITFTDSTLNGTISSLWNFGDPSSGASDTSSQVNGTHTYNSPGTYTATLYLTNACKTDTFTQQVVVGSVYASITVNSNATCGNNNGSATAVPSGGNGSFKYAWSNSDSTATVSNLSGNNYSVTVSSQGCSASASATIGSTSAVTVDTSSTEAGCSGGGSATVTPTGGSAPFSYKWDNGDTTATAPNLTGGNYQVTVTGAGNCSVTASVTVNSTGTPLIISASYTNTSCGNNNGTAKVTVTTGTATGYAWSNQATTDSISGLSAGPYSVTVTGSGGCSATASVTVGSSSNTPVTISSNKNIICSGDSAQICASTGYTTYTWNTSQTGQCIYAFNAGDYYLTATDTNGCTAQSNHLSISVYPVSSVSLVVQGDTLSSFGAVSYQWYFDGNPIPNANSDMYIARQNGEYTLQITDTNNCTALSSPVAVSTAGINELQNSIQFNIYPNPISQGMLQLEVSSALVGQPYRVFDALGRVVIQNIIAKQHSEIDMSLFSSGIYFIQIEGAVRKVVKE